MPVSDGPGVIMLHRYQIRHHRPFLALPQRSADARTTEWEPMAHGTVMQYIFALKINGALLMKYC